MNPDTKATVYLIIECLIFALAMSTVECFMLRGIMEKDYFSDNSTVPCNLCFKAHNLNPYVENYTMYDALGLHRSSVDTSACRCECTTPSECNP